MILSDDSLVMALFLQIHWIHRVVISKFTDLHWENTYIDMDVLSLCEITLNMDMMTSQHNILNSFIKKWYLRIISCQNKMGKKMFQLFPGGGARTRTSEPYIQMQLHLTIIWNYDVSFSAENICMIPSSDWKSEIMSMKEQSLSYNIFQGGRKSAKNNRNTGQRTQSTIL